MSDENASGSMMRRQDVRSHEPREGGMRTAAFWLGVLTLLLGLSGFFGPFVAGNEEGLINIGAGQLFGLFAINWVHALVYLTFGLYGFAAGRIKESAVTYLWTVAVAFGFLALLGFLGQVGWMEVRGPEGPLVVYEIAVDPVGSLLHLGLAAIGLFFALHAGGKDSVKEHQPAHA